MDRDLSILPGYLSRCFVGAFFVFTDIPLSEQKLNIVSVCFGKSKSLFNAFGSIGNVGVLILDLYCRMPNWFSNHIIWWRCWPHLDGAFVLCCIASHAVLTGFCWQPESGQSTGVPPCFVVKAICGTFPLMILQKRWTISQKLPATIRQLSLHIVIISKVLKKTTELFRHFQQPWGRL